MTTFVDTSGVYAVIDRDDANHGSAASCWQDLLASGTDLVTHNYVLVESVALAHRRLGHVAARVLHHDVLAVIEVVWVDEALHGAAMTALSAAARRDVSLVDWVSFEVMRSRGLERAFAFDEHFRGQGFTLIPGTP